VFKGSAIRLAASAAAVIVAGAGLAASGATTADAATVSHAVKYTCKVPVIGSQAVKASVALSAPSKATTGHTVKLTVKFQATGLPSVTVTNVTIKSAVTESGAQKGSVTLSEHLKSANSGSLKLTLTGRVKLSKTGTVKFKAGSQATFALTSSLIGKATVTCKATSSLPVLGSIRVSKPKSHSVLSAAAKPVADER
jgi:hypothetical protein